MIKPLFSPLENFISLLWEAIKELFSVEYGDYDNLGVSELTLERIRLVIIALYIGIIVGIYLAVFNKKVYSGLTRSLIAESAFSPESAKTLEEVGYLKNPAVTYAIRRGNVYKGVLRCVGKDEFDCELERKRELFRAKASAGVAGAEDSFRETAYKYDFTKDRFYIPEDRVYAAEEKFRTKGTSPVLAVILTLIIVAAMILTLKLLPDMIMLLNNFVGMFSAQMN